MSLERELRICEERTRAFFKEFRELRASRKINELRYPCKSVEADLFNCALPSIRPVHCTSLWLCTSSDRDFHFELCILARIYFHVVSTDIGTRYVQRDDNLVEIVINCRRAKLHTCVDVNSQSHCFFFREN